MSDEFQDRLSARYSEAEYRRVDERDGFLESHNIKVGYVVGTSQGGKRADVQISHNNIHNGENIEHSVLLDVPVLFPVSGRLFLGMTANDGDEVIIFFNDRSIDGHLDNGGQTYDLQESRIHDLSDAMCWPVCISDGGASSLESEGVDLIDCFLDLSAKVRELALSVSPPQATIAAEVLAITQKVENAR